MKLNFSPFFLSFLRNREFKKLVWRGVWKRTRRPRGGSGCSGPCTCGHVAAKQTTSRPYGDGVWGGALAPESSFCRDGRRAVGGAEAISRRGTTKRQLCFCCATDRGAATGVLGGLARSGSGRGVVFVSLEERRKRKPGNEEFGRAPLALHLVRMCVWVCFPRGRELARTCCGGSVVSALTRHPS